MVQGFASTIPAPKVACVGHRMTQCIVAFTIARASPHLSIWTELSELSMKRERKPTGHHGWSRLHRRERGAETKDPRPRRCGFGVAWILSNGGLLHTLGGRAGKLHGRIQSVARAELFAAVEVLRFCRSATQQVFNWTDCMFVINGFARGRRRKHLCHADPWDEFWKAHDAVGPSVLFHKVWRSHATEAEIAAGLISPLEAYGDEAADKLAARGALRTALSMEYVAATRSTDT